ncbi:MAG TPA: hypothetical protein VFT64_12225 [Rickettsiales bacterium]|nr:hypothetical protein [Rickettsiales bacterium]
MESGMILRGIIAVLVFLGLIGFLIWILRSGIAKGLSNSRTFNTVLGVVFLGIIFWTLKPETKERTPQEQACVEDWKKCADNLQMANNYHNWFHVQYICKQAAIKGAQYGTPEFPQFESFGRLRDGTDYVETGVVFVYEPDAKFQNAFGAMQHVGVECQYDLNKNEVVSVNIHPPE